jgi:RNA polymerase sigma-70 factor (ECF subfamily)
LGEIESLNLISEEPGLERQVGARQELARLKAIVAALPAQCRRVFELCKLDGLSYRQAASKMGLSEKTVENHLGRALARITDTLARSEPDKSETPPRSIVDVGRGSD